MPKKNKKITFRVDDVTFNYIERERVKLNYNKSQYINSLIKNKKIIVLDGDREIIYELNKIRK